MIWALLLAAGESKRMGTPKQLLPFGRTTVIETALEHILASAADRTLVVLGAVHDRLEPLLKRFPVSLTVNPDFREGMLSSVRWGIRHLPPDAGAALICLGDQPWITPETIDRVIHAFKTTGRGLVLPVHGKAGGHPLLIDLKYREEIESLNSAVGLRELLSRHFEDVCRVESGDAGILRDMDTPLEYEESK
jgi:molybdenum cofactor cytidylyltransferase